jgi:uncharacterized membrane protein
MDAVIQPNRSLSAGGLKILLGVLIAWNGALAVFFLVIGAFPVPIFLGLDVLGVWLAFRVSNRRAERTERVRVDSEKVEVARDDRTVWTSPTAFTRIEPVEGAVRVCLSGRAIRVARALSGPERDDFARALQAAVHQARKERG